MSCYGNYVFIIVTNKTFKTFKEAAYLTKTFSFNGKSKDAPDILTKKVFWKWKLWLNKDNLPFSKEAI